MPIRGSRNPMPKKGASATNLFSSHGKQKKDARAPLPATAVSLQKYAVQQCNHHAADLSGAVDKNLRHQPPRKR